MVHIDDQELRDGLTRHGVSELAEITTFTGVYYGASGDPQGVSIEVRDNGPDTGPRHRYTVTVTDPVRQRMATGNAYPTIERAIDGVHWEDLGRDRATGIL